ncbi:MAG: UDP-2,3-diacylglucosamine diphosphatase LpxI [Tateyamaria sp.]|uniref:LpxI family protein n=1 Tax=Tateyamaria sp. TaxID=1929288 RepID=UPI003295E33D
MPKTSLALIVGRGGLPSAVAEAQVEAPLVCALRGHDPEKLAVDIHFRIEHLGSMLDQLRTRGVTEVCFCGAINRPDIDPTQIDAATAPMVPVLAAAVAGGEDSALRAVLGLFEKAGFAVRAAHDLAPDLLPMPGVHSVVQPGADVATALPVAQAVSGAQGAADLGQACVVRNGRLIAREDARGTDAMLSDLAGSADLGDDPFGAMLGLAGEALDSAADWLSGPDAPNRKGGFLFKAPKPGQDLRVDLPTIGPNTVRHAARAGLDGIVIQAGGVMVLNPIEVRRTLDQAGMFLWVH